MCIYGDPVGDDQRYGLGNGNDEMVASRWVAPSCSFQSHRFSVMAQRGPVGSSNMQIAVYSNHATLNRPENLLAQSGSFVVSTPYPPIWYDRWLDNPVSWQPGDVLWFAGLGHYQGAAANVMIGYTIHLPVQKIYWAARIWEDGFPDPWDDFSATWNSEPLVFKLGGKGTNLYSPLPHNYRDGVV